MIRFIKITTLCLFIVLAAGFIRNCRNTDENALVNNYTRVAGYTKVKAFYLLTDDENIKIKKDESRLFNTMERRGVYLYSEVARDTDRVFSFLGGAKGIKFRIGMLDLKTGYYEHILQDEYLDRVNNERLVSLDDQKNPFILLSIFPRGGARGVRYWSIIDIMEKKEIFIHPQKLRRYEEPIEYTLEISEESYNERWIINLYDGNRAPFAVFRWDPIKKEYTDKVYEPAAEE